MTPQAVRGMLDDAAGCGTMTAPDVGTTSPAARGG